MVPKDPKKAFELYVKYAEQGCWLAQDMVGNSYVLGKCVDRDYKKAVEWYLKAAAHGYAPAQSTLGRMYERGLGVEKNEKIAIEWYQKASDQGYDTGTASLADMYEKMGTRKNLKKAKELRVLAFKQCKIPFEESDWGKRALNQCKTLYNLSNLSPYFLPKVQKRLSQ